MDAGKCEASLRKNGLLLLLATMANIFTVVTSLPFHNGLGFPNATRHLLTNHA
jgi:hypothetical protein